MDTNIENFIYFFTTALCNYISVNHIDENEYFHAFDLLKKIELVTGFHNFFYINF